MGAGYQRKTYTLRWPEGHVHHGLVVKLRGLSINQLNTVQSMRGVKSEDDLSAELFDEVLSILAGRMISWNLEDDGIPVPATKESLADEDFGMVTDIITSWTKAVTGVSAPLGARSNSGAPFPEESIPMETSSPSLTS